MLVNEESEEQAVACYLKVRAICQQEAAAGMLLYSLASHRVKTLCLCKWMSLCVLKSLLYLVFKRTRDINHLSYILTILKTEIKVKLNNC